MKLEAAKSHSGERDPLSLEPGELPSSYGRNRVVLLPVDPYLMYAYWELASPPPATAGARAVLRFHELSHPFDVEVDLNAGKSYIHLWSPAKVYQADLGLRDEDGSFLVLAQSNTVQSPPANPAPPQHAVPPGHPVRHAPVVAPPQPPAHIPPAHTPLAATAHLANEGSVPESAARRPSSAGPAPGVAAQWYPKLLEIFQPETQAPAAAARRPASAARPERAREAESRVAKAAFLAPAEALPGPSPMTAPTPFHLEALQEMDLTEYAESRFAPGVSSTNRGSEGGPLGQ